MYVEIYDKDLEKLGRGDSNKWIHITIPRKFY